MKYVKQFGIILLISFLGVKDAGKFLIEIMPLMFIPAAVGLIESWSIIKPSFLQYIIIAVVSTIAVMAVSGKVTQTAVRHNRKAVKEHD